MDAGQLGHISMKKKMIYKICFNNEQKGTA